MPASLSGCPLCQAAQVAVLGVDGWRGAWVGARLDGRRVELAVLPDAAAVLAVPDVDVVGIDMPIGLSDDGVRTCDVAARNALRGRGAAGSVFPAPVRAVLRARDYADARRLSVAATGGRSLSAQSFQLVRSIAALDDALGDPPADSVVEVHPELAFRALDDRVRDPKSSARGQAQRIRALEPVMDVLDALADAPAGVPAVDALDACAAAWSARRIADGLATCVGDGARDARGRPMRICW
jgi:predicted RNase H-like nuclease